MLCEGKVAIVTGGGRVKFDGADAAYNIIDQGYLAQSIVFTVQNGALKNELRISELRTRSSERKWNSVPAWNTRFC